MSFGASLSQEAHRYLPIAQQIAATIRKQLELNANVQDLIEQGAAGLEEAVTTFRRGHGTSFRIFAHYRVALAIYRSLNEMQWPNPEAFNRYRFYRKSDELMDWHSRSSESIPKRTRDAEVAELKKLLRVLIASAFLICERKQDVLEKLPPNQRDLLRFCFLQNIFLEQAALHLDLAKNTVLRLQFQTLQNLAAALSR